ncbi:MAG: hypothetical protein ACE5IR_09675 [bacterium]
MLHFLFDFLRVDYFQWRALFKIYLKRDFRQSAFSATLRHGRAGGRSFFTLIFYYFLVGFVFIPIILSQDDIYFSATLLITYTMFMIGSLILIEYHSVVISPEDYHILGFRPISSKTFFAVKLTNILFYILIFTTVLSLPGIAAFLFTERFSFTMLPLAFLSIFLANFTTCLIVIIFYTLILKKVSLRKVQNVLALLQVGLAFVIYSSFFILPKMLSASLQTVHTLSESFWLKLFPPTWFSSLLKIASPTAVNLDWVLAFAALFVTGALAFFAFSQLSLGYSEKLAALLTISDEMTTSRRRFTKPFLTFAKAHEERVVAKLIRNQFLYDNKFKMAVLGILPLTIFYLFLGTNNGPLPDPFEAEKFETGESGLLYLLIFLFPMMLRTYVTQSDAYQASWIFYTSAVNVRRLILSEKNFLMIYFVLPFLFILIAIFYYYFQNLLHVFLHILVLGLLAHLFLQFAFLYSPDLPFSRPNVKGSRSRNLALFLILFPFMTYLVLPFIYRYVYLSAPSFATFCITIFIVSVILESLIKVRVDAHLKKHEFVG